MSLIYISQKAAPVTWKQWTLALGIGFIAICILRYHLYYLDHLRVEEWSYRYLQVNRLNTAFTTKMRRAKLVVCVLWMAALAFGWRYSKQLLLHKQITPFEPACRRMAWALLAFLFTVVNYDPPDVELSFYFFINSLAFCGLIFALYRLPYSRLPLILLGKMAMRLQRIPTPLLVSGIALFIFTMSWQLGAVFFSHLPMTVDTSAQLVHAKIMTMGHWALKSHRLSGFFDMYEMINNGKWFSQYPPGHVMLLAIGTYFKLRTYVNPLLGALTSVAIFGLAREIYGLRVARIAAVLSAGCIYLIMMSSEFMSNATSLLMGTLFVWAYFRMLKTAHWKTGLWGGAAIGYCFITRPYTTLALAVPYMVYAAYLLLVQGRRYRRPLLIMAGVGALFVLFQLYFNAATTGHPFTFGYQLSWGDWHNPLTDEAAERLNEWEMAKNFRENMQRTGWFNRLTFEWPVPNLILLALLWGWRGNRRPERLMFATFASFLLSCQVLPGNVEREWGPRLCYETLSLIVVLSAKALSVLPAFFRVMCNQRRSLAYYYGFACMVAFGFYGFALEHNMQRDTIYSIYNFGNRGNNPAFYKYVMNHIEPPALVFVTGEMIYQAVSFTNPPTDESPAIFANDWGRDDKQLMNFYPDRNVYHAWIGRNGFYVDKLRMAGQMSPPVDKDAAQAADKDSPEGEALPTFGQEQRPADAHAEAPPPNDNERPPLDRQRGHERPPTDKPRQTQP